MGDQASANKRVALLTVGAGPASAVGSRVAAFSAGLAERGWTVNVVDVERASRSAGEIFLDKIPESLRDLLEWAGIEGDVMPRTGLRAVGPLQNISDDVAIVSVPPFSLIPLAAQALPTNIPLVIDYRDPWSSRLASPLLARATTALERRALRRAAGITYAGDQVLGRLLAKQFALPPDRIVAVPNGFDPADIKDLRRLSSNLAREGTPLDLVFGGYWYGRNGPGILLEALAQVGGSIASLTVIGHVSDSIRRRFEQVTGRAPTQRAPMSRRDLYQRLARADAAVITLDYGSAIESRIPAKCYDCLAVGVPVIAICPADAALLQVKDARRFHHVDHRDVEGLAALLRQAAADRTVLRRSTPGRGPTRDEGVAALAELLNRITADH
jgi:glycosyltransferase involved in cell wall biosynthesis